MVKARPELRAPEGGGRADPGEPVARGEGPEGMPPRYEPVRRLGRGGGGEVWAVRDRITGRRVALKALREGASEPEVLALVREAVALSGLEGLGVPRVLRFGRTSAGRAYLVREIVLGQSLADLLASGGALEDALEAIAASADQLTLLHRAGLLHGDVKPANVIVGEDGRATLVDLGLAAPWKEGGVRPEGLTPRYAAPELLEGAPLTVRAEVFALGVTLEEALAAGEGGISREARGALEAVAARARAAAPEARYPSADELASALRRAAGLPAPAGGAALAWPVLGLDEPAGSLLAQVGALRPGAGIVVTGPKLSGKTTLLRRVAWSLGAAGRAVAWLEPADAEAGTLAEALEVELASPLAAAPGGAREVILLIDDADRLDAGALARVEALRAEGARLVLALGEGNAALPSGPTLEVFAVPPLPPALASQLVLRAIPSLGEAVVAHVVARAEERPGRIKRIVARLAGAPVVSPADVDERLEGEDERTGRTEGPAGRAAEVAEIEALLDRGHFEEAAERLARLEEDASPPLVVARARLATNRGEPGRALSLLGAVEGEVRASDDPRLRAAFELQFARAELRAGNYAAAEQRSLEAEREASEASEASLAAEALAVCGLALSYASRHDEARAALGRAVEVAREEGEPRLLSVALGSLAFALQRDDRLDEARSAYEEALEAATRAGDAGSVATTRLNLAGIAKTGGDLGAAIAHLEASVDMGRRSGRRATLRQALLNLANLELYIGRLARGRATLDALALERAELPPHQAAQLFALEAEYAARAGDLAEADRLCLECARAYEATGRGVDEAEARLERVVMLSRSPSLLGAGALPALAAEVGRAEARLAHTTAHRALLAFARARLAELGGDEEGAAALFGESLDAARASGQRDWAWRALEARAALEDSLGQALRARRNREEALAVLEEIASKLPRDLREVFWNEPRRKALREACLLGFTRPSASEPGPASGFVSSGLLPASRRAEGASGHGPLAAGIPPEDRLARILEINRAIAGEYDLHRLLDKVTDHAIALVRAERGLVLLRGERQGAGDAEEPIEIDKVSRIGDGSLGELRAFAARGASGDDPHGRFSRGIAERVIETGEPIVTQSAKDDARMASYVSVHQLMLQSVACVPIRARSGRPIGALYFETRLPRASSFAAELPTLTALADQVAIAIETARLVGENARRARELERANAELEAARRKLEERVTHRTAQLQATRRDLRTARSLIKGHFGYEGLVGTSEAMRKVYALVDRIKDTDVPVLITGESGTGKEVIARAIHNAGPRGKQAFVGVNCGAIPEHLLESELFGHVRGAFTGADRDRKGLFREATEGTILLDEIGEMPQKMQAGLLRVLQERVVRPVGGAREERVGTRVVAATHRDLARMVQQGAFREDLYYRLNVVQVRVPPLRERAEDIPVLIDHFLAIFAARYGRERQGVSRAALRRLQAYSWPGNVRQLEHALLNAWVLSDRPELEPDDFDLPDAGRAGPAPPAAPAAATRAGTVRASASREQTALDSHRATEKERILEALSACNWNRVKAAQVVGLPRRTFYRRLKEYGIQ